MHNIILSVTFLLFCSHSFGQSGETRKDLQSQTQGAELAGPLLQGTSDSSFVNLTRFTKEFVIDMKYAGNENFLKQKVYDCGECYLRQKTAFALLDAQNEFRKLGYGIKVFDCYRPLSVQKRMWKIVNNPKYVADPAKGSIHNRGNAVDITLVDSLGNELDMGTSFDHFGEESAHSYFISQQVTANRALLRSIMERHGFEIFESEWWHYNLRSGKKDPVADFVWPCR